MLNEHFGIGLALTTLLLLVGHWLPKPRDLHPIIRYTAGVAAILVGAGWWLASSGLAEVALGLALLALAAGIAVLLAYGYDAMRRMPTVIFVLRELMGKGDERDTIHHILHDLMGDAGERDE